MRLPSRLFFVFVCLLISTPVWAQGSPVVYVSSGATIFSVTTATGVVSPLVTNSGADYEGLVVGPNNDPGTSSAHPYLLYACDPTNNKIIRFDPNSVAAGTDTVYQGTAAHKTLQQPQCGRLDSAGDLIVNSEAAGSGAWKIVGVATLPLGTLAANFPAPVQLGTAISAAQAGRGVTQKFVGDLLAVDQVGNRVVRSMIQLPASSTSGYSFGTSSAFINTNLSSPFGIARNNVGQVYVSEHTSNKKGDVQLFDPTGTFLNTCVSTQTFGNQQPNFLGVAEDGTLYVAAASSNAGFVWSVTQSAAGTCTATQLATTTSLPTLTGIALPPTQTSISLSQAGQGTLSYNFGSSLFNLTTGACTLAVTKTLLPAPALNTLANINGPAMIDGVSVALTGGVAAPFLGDQGFATKYSAPDSDPDTCANTAFEYLIAAFVDQDIFPNPWIIRCDPVGSTNCVATDVHGIYFLGGFLPDDLGTASSGPHHSDFFVANMNLNGSHKGTLNLESPLTQVAPPKLAGTFSSGSTISVKFKFTPGITNAEAILAVAQVCQPGTPSTNDPICGPNGQASVFPINIINIDAEGSSTVPPPIVTSGNQQYSFSLSLKGYAPGIYSLSVITLSNNSSPVTVIVKII